MYNVQMELQDYANYKSERGCNEETKFDRVWPKTEDFRNFEN